VDGQAGGPDEQAGQGRGVLGKHGPQGGIGDDEDVLDEVPLHRLGLGLGLPDRLQEGDSLENEEECQHDIADQEMTGRLRRDELLDAVRDRHCSTRDEQPERGEQ